MKIYLISEETLKEDSLINDNTGSEFIGPAIETSQNIYLQELIGTKLLNKICDLVDTGDITGTTYAVYKTLLDDYITPYLNFKVMSEIQVPLSYKMRNLGTIQTNDTNISSTQLKDVQVIATYYDNRASFYANRLSKYLIANSNSYPEYCSTDSFADFKSDTKVFKCPIFLG